MAELGEGTVANLTNAINQLTGQLSGGQWKSTLSFPTSQMSLGGPAGLGGQLGGALGGQTGSMLGGLAGMGAMMAFGPQAFAGLRDSPYQSTYQTNMSQAVIRDSFAERGERAQAFGAKLGLSQGMSNMLPFAEMLAPGAMDTAIRLLNPDQTTSTGGGSIGRAMAFNRNIRGWGDDRVTAERHSFDALLTNRPSGLRNIMADDVAATYEFVNTRMGASGERARNITASLSPLIRQAATSAGLGYGDVMSIFDQQGVNSLGRARLSMQAIGDLSTASAAAGDSTASALAKANGLAGSTLLGQTLSMGLATRAELIGAEGLGRGASANEVQRRQTDLVRFEAGGQERDMRMKVAAYVSLYGSSADKAGLAGGGEQFINRFAARNATAIGQITGEDIRNASTEDPATMRAAQQIRQNAMAKEAMARAGVDPRGGMGSADFLKLANAGLLGVAKGFQAEDLADRGARSATVGRISADKRDGENAWRSEGERGDLAKEFKEILADFKNGNWKKLLDDFMALFKGMAGNIGLVANTTMAGNSVGGPK